MTKLYDDGYTHGIIDNAFYAASPKYDEKRTSTRTMARLFIPMNENDAEQYKSAVKRSVQGSVDDLLNAIVVTVDGGTILGGGYLYFLMSSASEQHREKVQIVETMTDDYIAYTFGSAPPVFNYSGILPNTMQDDWRVAFYLLYQHLIRASKLALHRKSVVLSYDNMLITGSLVAQEQTLTADAQMSAGFSFSLLVKRITILQRTGLYVQAARQAVLAAFTPPAFASLGSGLLGLVASVSGNGSSADSPFGLRADSPLRSIADPTSIPTREELIAATQDGVDAVNQFINTYPSLPVAASPGID